MVSCSKKEIEPTGEEQAQEKYTNFVSMDEAKMLLTNVLSQMDAITKSNAPQRKIAGSFKLENFASTKSDGTETSPLYVFNFESDNGFAIATSDKRLPPFLAITDPGSGNWDGEETDNPGFNIFLANTQDYLTMMSEEFVAEDSLTAATKCYQDSWHYHYTQYTVTNQVGHPMAVAWYQGDPTYPNYNKYCPVIGDKTAITGCVAVAVAQIMYYYGRPYSYNGYGFDWNTIKTNLYATQSIDMAARLMQQVGLSGNLSMSYGIQSSSSSTKDAPRTFRNFGFSSGGTYKSFNFSEVDNEIRSLRPLIVRGSNGTSGHAWVIDAVMNTRVLREFWFANSTSNSGNEWVSNELVHCNWGWGSSWKGWFYHGCFNAKYPVQPKSKGLPDTPTYYRYNIDMVTGIYP